MVVGVVIVGTERNKDTLQKENHNQKASLFYIKRTNKPHPILDRKLFKYIHALFSAFIVQFLRHLQHKKIPVTLPQSEEYSVQALMIF